MGFDPSEDNESTASSSSTSSLIEIPESTIQESPTLQELRRNPELQHSHVTAEEVHHIYTYRSQKYRESAPVLSRLSITLLLAFHSAFMSSDTTSLEIETSFEKDLAYAFSTDLWTVHKEKEFLIDLGVEFVGEAIESFQIVSPRCAPRVRITPRMGLYDLTVDAPNEINNEDTVEAHSTSDVEILPPSSFNNDSATII